MEGLYVFGGRGRTWTDADRRGQTRTDTDRRGQTRTDADIFFFNIFFIIFFGIYNLDLRGPIVERDPESDRLGHPPHAS